MISKNFVWWLVMFLGFVTIIINTMFENWLVAFFMILPTLIAFQNYIKNRKLGQ